MRGQLRRLPDAGRLTGIRSGHDVSAARCGLSLGSPRHVAVDDAAGPFLSGVAVLKGEAPPELVPFDPLR